MSLFQLWSFQLELLLFFFCLNNSVEDGGFKKGRPDQRFALDLINNSVLFLLPTTSTPINNKIFPPTQYNTNIVPVNSEKRMMNLWRLVQKLGKVCAETESSWVGDAIFIFEQENTHFLSKTTENQFQGFQISHLRFHLSDFISAEEICGQRERERSVYF